MRPTPESSEFLTPEEARRVLRVSRSKIYELLAQHRIKHAKIGRVIRIRRTALEAFIENNTTR